MYFRLRFKTATGSTREAWVSQRTEETFEVVDRWGDPLRQFIRLTLGPVAKVETVFEDGTRETTHLVRRGDVSKMVPATMDKFYGELEVTK